MPTCSKCRVSKLTDQFYKNSAQKTGLSNQCRECVRQTNTASRKVHRERARMERKRYAESHPDVIKSIRVLVRKRYDVIKSIRVLVMVR